MSGADRTARTAGRRRDRAARRAPTTAWPCSSPAPAPDSARPSPASSRGSARRSSSRAASPSTSTPAALRSSAIGAPVLTVACDIRDAEQIAAAFDAAEAAVRPARRARQQRGRQLPGAGRGHVAERVAHRRRHHAQRHVPLLPRVRPPPPRRGHARARSSTSARRTRGPAVPGSCTPRPPRPA